MNDNCKQCGLIGCGCLPCPNPGCIGKIHFKGVERGDIECQWCRRRRAQCVYDAESLRMALTVSALIAKLQQFPPDALVTTESPENDGDSHPTYRIELLLDKSKNEVNITPGD